MSQRVFEGDEWKRGGTDTTPPESRESKQHTVNMDFAFGVIDRATWNKRTDELSEPTKQSYPCR